MVAILLFGAALAAQSSWGYLPSPLIPDDNPMSAAKTALGELLFHDPRLSTTGSHSCATCHQPQRYLTDGLPTAIGALGDPLPFNTPALYYSAFNASLGWQEDGPTSLEAQHCAPLFNRDPVELGFGAPQLRALQRDSSYKLAFDAAFGTTDITTEHMIKALATYIRSLQPPATPFDRYMFEDDDSGMSEDAKAGLALFFSARLGCSECHASLAFSGPIRHSVQDAQPVYHVMGVSENPKAMRAPSLRYVRHTAPYMHDGSMSSLEEVLAHYQTRPSARVPAFTLSAEDQAQLLAFLRTL